MSDCSPPFWPPWWAWLASLLLGGAVLALIIILAPQLSF